jgi:predicted glycoside hydrolase/deacetylase ChbG (UPF0249 family)
VALTRLIVNADDLGWSAGVNRGIADAHRSGILTSTTLLTNFPAFDDAVSLLPALPRLGVGLHLNIVHGAPLSPPASVPSLVNSAGRFPGSTAVLRRLLLGRIRAAELHRELDAQLTRFRNALGEPTHLDSHKHMHLFGCFREVAVALASSLKEPRLRCPLQPMPPSAHSLSLRLKTRLFEYGAKPLRRMGRRAGLTMPDRFEGIGLAALFTPNTLIACLASLRPGVTELMCHPGYPSDDQHAVVPHVAVTETREKELRALMDPAVCQAVRDQHVELIHYGNI